MHWTHRVQVQTRIKALCFHTRDSVSVVAFGDPCDLGITVRGLCKSRLSPSDFTRVPGLNSFSASECLDSPSCLAGSKAWQVFLQSCFLTFHCNLCSSKDSGPGTESDCEQRNMKLRYLGRMKRPLTHAVSTVTVRNSLGATALKPLRGRLRDHRGKQNQCSGSCGDIPLLATAPPGSAGWWQDSSLTPSQPPP